MAPVDTERLESEISLDELTRAVHTMKKGKTPGSNGFPAEFFKVFWLELGPFLHRAFAASLLQNQRLPSHREGIVKMIPKLGKSPHTLKGWRPITLLNVDYKIVSAAIANRFKSVLDKIISPSQTAYISGRYIGENTRLLFDIISLAKHRNSRGAILAADFEAAFESVSWDYLRSTMTSLGFGKNFLKIIDLMYLNPRNYSRIMINGHLGPEVSLQRGIRQGDSSSGYLFDIAVEILAGLINNSQQMNGINISPSKQIRISQYADDTILLLDGSAASIKGALQELIKFADLSGLKINLDKTSCMPIGSSTASQIPSTLNIKVVEELKILGICLSNNTDHLIERNLIEKLPSIRRDIEQWNRRNLTPVGKICIVKTLLISKLVHLFMALPNPSKERLKQIESLIYNFVWKNRGDKIKRTKLVQNYENDGLKMVDIKAFIDSMKLAWLKRLILSDADWTHLAYMHLPDATDLLTFGKEKLTLIKNKATNHFYRDLISALVRFSIDHKPSNEEILSEVLWYSDHTKYSNTVVRCWDKKGLRFIGDLFNQITCRLYTKEEVENKYNIQMTFLCYESLVRSLPHCLRNTENNKIEYPNIPFKIKAVLSKPKFSKYAYNIFIGALAKKHTSTDFRLKEKWERDIGFYIMGTTKRLMNATLSSYFIYFHYRLVSRIFSTNKSLHCMKIKPSSECSFCRESIETIAHLFWFCPKVKIFIKEVLSHLKQKYDKVVDIDVGKWFFLSEVQSIDVIVITVCKYAIHRARLKESTPSITMMLNILKMEAEKEYSLFISKNRLSEFETKWGTLKQILI